MAYGWLLSAGVALSLVAKRPQLHSCTVPAATNHDDHDDDDDDDGGDVEDVDDGDDDNEPPAATPASSGAPP